MPRPCARPLCLAREVLALCRSGSGTTEDAYYREASEAEAELVLGNAAVARDALARAASHGGDLAARAAGRRQLRLVCAARSIPEDVLSPLAPPTVIHFTGHMITPAGRSGRFPAEQESQVASAITAVLERNKVGFAYGALASGADILFAEALLTRGAELHVVLPFALDEFVEISVVPGGDGWKTRFDACLAHASSVIFATDDRYLGHDWIFAYGSYVAMGLAVLRARFLDAEVRQVAVWDGEETSGIAGTGFDVRTWSSHGRTTDVIPCGPASASSTPHVSPSIPKASRATTSARYPPPKATAPCGCIIWPGSKIYDQPRDATRNATPAIASTPPTALAVCNAGFARSA